MSFSMGKHIRLEKKNDLKRSKRAKIRHCFHYLDLTYTIFRYNCSVFVYGATGAGKTHTMLGSTNNPGITFRTVMELYKKIDELKDDRTVEVAVSYLEVYNESIIDLINPESGQLAIRDDGKSANIAGNGHLGVWHT